MRKNVRPLVMVLVIGSGVVAILLGTWVALSVPEQELRAEVRFKPSRPAYIWGEEVTVLLENRGEVSFCTTTGTSRVERLVGNRWFRAESHSSIHAALELKPGEVWEIPWGPRTDVFWPHSGDVQVVPGEYRMKTSGWFCDAPSSFKPDDIPLVVLFAYFKLI